VVLFFRCTFRRYTCHVRMTSQNIRSPSFSNCDNSPNCLKRIRINARISAIYPSESMNTKVMPHVQQIGAYSVQHCRGSRCPVSCDCVAAGAGVAKGSGHFPLPSPKHFPGYIYMLLRSLTLKSC